MTLQMICLFSHLQHHGGFHKHYVKNQHQGNTSNPQYIDKFYLIIYHLMIQYCQVQ
eukprot:UN10280